MTDVTAHQTRATPSNSPVPRRNARLPRTARRAQLMAAARDVFVSRGYHATGMEEIALRAGVSKPVLYQHFPGKLDLYLDLLHSYVDDLVRLVREALNSTTDNKQRVHAAVAAYFDFIDADGQGYRLVFESDLLGEPSVQQRVDRGTEQCIDAVTEAVMTDAGLDPHRARLLAAGLVGVSQVGARYWLGSDRPVPKSEAIEIISSLVWGGVAHLPLQNGQERDATPDVTTSDPVAPDDEGS
jgi:AcrR family transcriptional regulator